MHRKLTKSTFTFSNSIFRLSLVLTLKVNLHSRWKTALKRLNRKTNNSDSLTPINSSSYNPVLLECFMQIRLLISSWLFFGYCHSITDWFFVTSVTDNFLSLPQNFLMPQHVLNCQPMSATCQLSNAAHCFSEDILTLPTPIFLRISIIKPWWCFHIIESEVAFCFLKLFIKSMCEFICLCIISL